VSCVLCLAVLTPAAASPVTWSFAGRITRVQDDDNLLQGAIGIGTPFFGQYTFESATPDAFPANARLGRYIGALLGVSGRIGELDFFEVPESLSFINVIDDDPIDNHVVSGSTGFLGTTVSFVTSFSDSGGTLISDDSLLLVPPRFDLIGSTGFRIQNPSQRLVLIGGLTSLVPEPGSLVLLMAGCTVLALQRRCQ
ncbi:MAG: PEP-CTERM sorting domain-containing protein, partial [Phycisphaerae bacterium]